MGLGYSLFVKPVLSVLSVLAALAGIYLLPEYWPDHRIAALAIADDDAQRLSLYLRRGLDPNDRSRWRSSLRYSFLRSGPSTSREQGSLGDASEPLLGIALRDCRVPLAGLLVDAGADVAVRDASGASALSQAAVCGDAALVRRLLERGANVNAIDPDGGTALWEKTNLGWRHRPLQPAIVALLERAGAARPGDR